MPDTAAATWILVAHRSGATLYAHRHVEGVRLVERVAGLRSDSPLHGADLADPKARATSVEMVRYTLRIAELLEARCREDSTASIILMAESRMLGAIRRHLSADTARHIQASLNVAQPEWDEASLAQQLAPFFAENRSSKCGAEML